MKTKYIIRILIILTSTLAFLWAIPALVEMATYSSQNYPFVYYSSVVKEFCFKKSEGKEVVRYDTKGRHYTEAEYDSVLPMLYYRQLAVNGKMPDSINGVAVTAPEIRRRGFVFRYNKSEISRPHIGLYVLLESMSGRVNLQSPGDAFRFKDNIEFIDIESNTVDYEKSEMYSKELARRGYTFPTQWAQGDFNTHKSYDEGYFALDANGQFFHMKQVSGKPFIRNTKVGDSIDVAHFSLLSVADKRFYGFVFDTDGCLYMLESPKYQLRKVDLPAINMRANDMVIMGNMFFWTVNITSSKGKMYYAIDNETLQKVDEYFIPREVDMWDKASVWLFPAYITLTDSTTKFIQPKIHFTAFTAFILNLILAFAFAIFARKKKRVMPHSIYILLTGVAGLIAILITPDFE